MRTQTSPVAGVGDIWENPNLHLTIVEVCNRSYWTRLWIVQELRLPARTRIVCGRYATDLQSLRIVFHGWTDAYREQNLSKLGACETIFRWMSDQDGLGPFCGIVALLQAVRYFSEFRCSEKLDRLYGLLGLTQQPDLISVDYNISAEMLFLNVVDQDPRDIDLDQLQALAETLDIIVTFAHGNIGLQSCRESSKEIPESPKPGMWSDHVSDSEVLNFGNRTTAQQRVINSSFEWHRQKCFTNALPERVIQVLNAKARRCKCSLCKVTFSDDQFLETTKFDKSSLQIHRVAETIRYRPGQRSFTVYVASEGDQYLLTILNFGKASTLTAVATFRDPFHLLWKVRTSEDTLQILLISVLLLLAHVENWLSAERREVECSTVQGFRQGLPWIRRPTPTMPSSYSPHLPYSRTPNRSLTTTTPATNPIRPRLPRPSYTVVQPARPGCSRNPKMALLRRPSRYKPPVVVMR